MFSDNSSIIEVYESSYTLGRKVTGIRKLKLDKLIAIERHFKNPYTYAGSDYIEIEEPSKPITPIVDQIFLWEQNKQHVWDNFYQLVKRDTINPVSEAEFKKLQTKSVENVYGLPTRRIYIKHLSKRITNRERYQSIVSTFLDMPYTAVYNDNIYIYISYIKFNIYDSGIFISYKMYYNINRWNLNIVKYGYVILNEYNVYIFSNDIWIIIMIGGETVLVCLTYRSGKFSTIYVYIV